MTNICGWAMESGSGAVESAHKQVVHARLRQAGMRWSEAGARRLLALRLLLLNGDWALLDRLRMVSLAYGFGWENMRYKGVRYMIHPGGWAGFKSFILRFPDQGFSAIALSKHSEFDLTNLPLAIARVYLADRIEVPTKIFNMQ
jgi:hypothetical protein